MAKYPDECIQNLIDSDWWEEYTGPEFRPGRLIWAFLPYIDQKPFTLLPVSRGGKNGTEHEKALFKLHPLDIKQVIRYPRLPLAALPNRDKEVWTVYRAKRRPALIIGKSGRQVDKKFRKGKAEYQTKLTVLVAPSYGADESRRSGYTPELIARIQRCEYPQFIWDILPIHSQTKESIIRLDQLQPVGKSTDSIEFTNYCLTEEALGLVYEWMEWLMTGQVDEDSLFNEYREFLRSL